MDYDVSVVRQLCNMAMLVSQQMADKLSRHGRDSAASSSGLYVTRLSARGLPGSKCTLSRYLMDSHANSSEKNFNGRLVNLCIKMVRSLQRNVSKT